MMDIRIDGEQAILGPEAAAELAKSMAKHNLDQFDGTAASAVEITRPWMRAMRSILEGFEAIAEIANGPLGDDDEDDAE